MSKARKANTKFLKGHEIDAANDSVTFIRKQRRKLNTGLSQLELKEISPLTENQTKLFDSFNDDKHIVAYGSAGTGKTFCLLYLAIQELIYNNNFEKIIIFRSAVASRNVGFLPGNIHEKMEVFEVPYKVICNDLFGRSDAYEIMKKKELIQFESTSYTRGATFDDCMIIVDEFSNLTFHEIDTIITRLGKNSRIFFSGDIRQCDLDNKKEISGFADFMQIITQMESFSTVEFNIEDCVRSGTVKEYLTIKDKLGL